LGGEPRGGIRIGGQDISDGTHFGEFGEDLAGKLWIETCCGKG